MQNSVFHCNSDVSVQPRQKKPIMSGISMVWTQKETLLGVMIIKTSEMKDIISRLINSDKRYILMSRKLADTEGEQSLPYIATGENGRYFVTLFYSYDDAAAYAAHFGYDKIGGHSPIAELPSTPKALIRFLFGLMNNGVSDVAIVNESGDGVCYDIMRLILDFQADLDSSYNALLVDALPISRLDAVRAKAANHLPVAADI